MTEEARACLLGPLLVSTFTTDVSSSVVGVENDASGFAYGAGFGVKAGQMGKIELEYTGVTGDNNINFLSLGGLLEF